MGQVVGLIAGSGNLPELLAHEARKKGQRVAACAIKGETDQGVETWADVVEWIRLGELGRVIRFFKREGVRDTLMGGKITKTNLFQGHIHPDLEMIRVLAKTRDHSDDSLLGGIASFLNEEGVSVLDLTAFLTEEVLPQKGVLSRRRPSKGETEDIEYGWRLAKEIGRLDIGQTVVVKKKAILAVEAIEGTDQAILRGGSLAGGDVVVVKVAKPKQDMRFDVPTLGLGTLGAMVRARAQALAFEAGKTILLDRKCFLEGANREDMAIVGL